MHTLCSAQMFGKLYMSTAVQYTAAAVLGVVWLNREREACSGGCTNSCSGGCANYVVGVVPGSMFCNAEGPTVYTDQSEP